MASGCHGAMCRAPSGIAVLSESVAARGREHPTRTSTAVVSHHWGSPATGLAQRENLHHLTCWIAEDPENCAALSRPPPSSPGPGDGRSRFGVEAGSVVLALRATVEGSQAAAWTLLTAPWERDIVWRKRCRWQLTMRETVSEKRLHS